MLAIVILVGCTCEKKKDAAGVIRVTFEINAPNDDLQPSYQTAIWLEDAAGRTVGTLFVSEYLSYGGYNDSTICPAWSSSADWEQATQEEFDARTQATPPAGRQELLLPLAKALPRGEYSAKMQLHLWENYNILYSGRLVVGDKADSTIAEKSYVPAPFKGAEKVLSHVTFHYVPE